MRVVDSETAVQQDVAVLEPEVVPQPTFEFEQRLRQEQATVSRPLPIPTAIPIPIPWVFGSRLMIWKQDPSLRRLGYRLTYLPNLILNGPRDTRINTSLPGTTPIVRNANGDFIFRPETPESDCAHSFAVVRQTLTVFEQARDGKPIPWAWNKNGNTSVISVFPRGFTAPNAFYSRNQKSLKFGFFTPSSNRPQVFTCRSLDIVAHEAGHAILDGLKPGWLAFGNPPQTGGLHESFGDLAAVFLALSQLDQDDALIALTKANLHAKKNFLAAVAEEFGSALGRPMGLRNADNNLKLSQVSNEVHAISQVFTGAIYDIMADIFAFEWRQQQRPKLRGRIKQRLGPEHLLLEVSRHLCKLLLKAIEEAPATKATYAHVVNQMLKESKEKNDPTIYRTYIWSRFAFREVLVPPMPLEETAMATGKMDLDNPDFADECGEVVELEQAHPDHPSLMAPQDRSGTCGTMQLPEYARDDRKIDADCEQLIETGEPIGEEELLTDEVEALAAAFK